MTGVVIASADQSVVFQLRSAIDEMDGIRVDHVVYGSDELVAAVLRLDPDVVLVHDELGPVPALQSIRELGVRRPSCQSLLVTSAPATPDVLRAGMTAGARGMVSVPVSFEDLRAQIESAAEASGLLRQLLTTSSGLVGEAGRGRLLAVTGAKGGCGATTVATHLALDLVRADPERRVCLVDLDLEKGDVAAVIEVRARASIADVAKVADDLSSRAVLDAVVVHASGVHLLLPPQDVRDVEAVTPPALREILAQLRAEFDVVVLDAGSHVTPVQLAAVESADEVVVVTTPDVVALRGLRRTIAAWEQFAVRKESDVRVLVNRVSRSSSVSADAVRQLTRAPILPIAIPAMFRRLEPALNARDPYAVREQTWWRALRAIAAELGLVTAPAAQPGRRGGGRPARSGERGSVSIELVGALPMVLLVVAIAWQLALYGMASMWVGHASSVAARAASIGSDPQVAAARALPAGVDVAVAGGSATGAVTVTMHVPLVAPGVLDLPVTVTSTRGVVLEP